MHLKQWCLVIVFSAVRLAFCQNATRPLIRKVKVRFRFSFTYVQFKICRALSVGHEYSML